MPLTQYDIGQLFVLFNPKILQLQSKHVAYGKHIQQH